jgi:hypothetical protein
MYSYLMPHNQLPVYIIVFCSISRIIIFCHVCFANWVSWKSREREKQVLQTYFKGYHVLFITLASRFRVAFSFYFFLLLIYAIFPLTHSLTYALHCFCLVLFNSLVRSQLLFLLWLISALFPLLLSLCLSLLSVKKWELFSFRNLSSNIRLSPSVDIKYEQKKVIWVERKKEFVALISYHRKCFFCVGWKLSHNFMSSVETIVHHIRWKWVRLLITKIKQTCFKLRF